MTATKSRWPFSSSDFINPKRGERLDGVPIDAPGDPAVEEPEQGVGTHVFLGGHIAEGTIDQLHEQLTLVGFGMQRFGVIPVEALGSGGMVVAVRTAETFGSDTQIDHPAQDRQMTQRAWFIHPIGLREQTPTAATGRALQGTFDREDEFARFGPLRLQDTYIRDIQRDRNQRRLWHLVPPFPSSMRCCPYPARSRCALQPLHLVALPAIPGEPGNSDCLIVGLTFGNARYDGLTHPQMTSCSS